MVKLLIILYVHIHFFFGNIHKIWKIIQIICVTKNSPSSNMSFFFLALYHFSDIKRSTRYEIRIEKLIAEA